MTKPYRPVSTVPAAARPELLSAMLRRSGGRSAVPRRPRRSSVVSGGDARTREAVALSEVRPERHGTRVSRAQRDRGRPDTVTAVAVDLGALADDLGAETNVLLAVVEPLAADGWATPTPAPGWRIQEQVAHLAYFDEQAALAATDAEAFTAELERALADPDGITERIAVRSRGMTGADVLDWFRAARADMVATFLALDPSTRVPWYGPPMSVASSLTARIMETWAHGQDVFDALRVEHPVTAALHHVAYLGVRTFGYSFVVNDLEPPDVAVLVELVAPDGGTWTFGERAAADRVRGPAVDFALVVTQRRNLADTALEITGDAADRWMHLAQAFAGPPGAGREATRA
jgi:uncharacterized protein (TIGR03084 family)